MKWKVQTTETVQPVPTKLITEEISQFGIFEMVTGRVKELRKQSFLRFWWRPLFVDSTI